MQLIIPLQPMLLTRCMILRYIPTTRAIRRPSLVVFRLTPRSTPTRTRPAHLHPRSVQDWKILHRPCTLWTMDLLQVLPPSWPCRMVAIPTIPARGRTQPQPHQRTTVFLPAIPPPHTAIHSSISAHPCRRRIKDTHPTLHPRRTTARPSPKARPRTRHR